MRRGKNRMVTKASKVAGSGHDRIVSLVQQRMKLAGGQGRHDGRPLERVDREIEILVTDYYGLSPDQRVRISECLKMSGDNIRIIREMFPTEQPLLMSNESDDA
jgi:hypothetical protein